MDLGLSITEQKATWWEGLVGLINRRRQQLQDWEAHPPHALGWGIFGLVVLELVLVRRFSYGLGLHPRIFAQLIGTGFLILLLEGLFAKITLEVGGFFHKKGNWKTTWTFLNLSLLPFLLYLPLALLASLGGGHHIGRTVFLFLLFLKVLDNWKEAIQISNELNRLQSLLVLGITLSMLVFLFLARRLRPRLAATTALSGLGVYRWARRPPGSTRPLNPHQCACLLRRRQADIARRLVGMIEGPGKPMETHGSIGALRNGQKRNSLSRVARRAFPSSPRRARAGLPDHVSER